MKLLLGLFLATTHAWTSSQQQPSKTSFSRTAALFNVPPPSQEDTVAFKKYASNQSPPASFFELQQDCIRSCQMAIEDGVELLEVEFPPLPAKVLELDDVSAYDVASANLKLAIEFARGFAGEKNTAILFPDQSESQIAVERLTGKEDYVEPVTEIEAGITISSLRRSEEGDDRLLKVGSFLMISNRKFLQPSSYENNFLLFFISPNKHF